MEHKFDTEEVKKEIDRLEAEVNSRSVIDEFHSHGAIDILKFIESNTNSLNKASQLMSVMNDAIASQQDLIMWLNASIEDQHKKIIKHNRIQIALIVFVCILVVMVVVL